MPFIDNDFKITTSIQVRRILMTTADDSLVYKAAENLAYFLQNQGQSILLVDGDLGNGPNENKPLTKVLDDKAAIAKDVKKMRHLAILGGKSEISLAQNSDVFKKQFLSDLQLYEENYDRTITAIESKNIDLQNLWLTWADKTFLFFQNESLSMEKTAEFLSTHPNQICGLIGTNPNPHETRLAWMRLKEVIPDTPELVLDIKKIAL